MYVRRNSKYFWGSNCRCYTTSILADEDDFINSLNNDTPLDTSRGAIKDVPESYKSWVADNADRIERAKAKGTLPYFLRDNEGYSGLYDKKSLAVKYGYKTKGNKPFAQISEYLKKENNQPTKISAIQKENINDIAAEFNLKAKPMNFIMANEGKGNVNYSKGGKFTKNCQSAVLVHEARLRGLNVTALAYNKKGVQFEIGADSSVGWIDPITKNKPDLTYISGTI